MDEATLGITMKHICRYFGKQEPKADTLNEWMNDLRSIPDEPMTWIEQKIKSNEYPHNPPVAIRKLWYQYLQEHPEKKAKESSGCDGCDSGYLFAIKNKNSYIFRCDQCNKYGESIIPVSNRIMLDRTGYKLSWTHKTTEEIKQMPEYVRGRILFKDGPVGFTENAFKVDDWHDQF